MASGLVLPDTIQDPAPATVIESDWGDGVNTAIAWLADDRPGCKVARTTDFAIPHNTSTAIDFTAADIYDIGGWHNPASNPHQVVVPAGEDGIYDGYANVLWEALSNNTGRDLRVFVNGAAITERSFLPFSQPGSNLIGHSLPFRLPLVGGDIVEVRLQQTNGGSASQDIDSAVLAIDWFRAHP